MRSDPAGAVLSWSRVSKRYGRRTLFSVLTGELLSGQATAVTGTNGSGKSTFLKICAGLLAADSGDVVRPPVHRIGYCSPSSELYGELTGEENLMFFADLGGIDGGRCRDLLAQVGLAKSAGRLYESYSSGMRQRLKLAFALIGEPDLLILDEPTIALDSEGVRIVDDIIGRHLSTGGAALIATNDGLEASRWAANRMEIGSRA